MDNFVRKIHNVLLFTLTAIILRLNVFTISYLQSFRDTKHLFKKAIVYVEIKRKGNQKTLAVRDEWLSELRMLYGLVSL
ncbi:MAG: hypothetical protein FT714_12385 [Pantoea sp. Pent]|nr:hypothetical protein [Pantoea sp. Pent]